MTILIGSIPVWATGRLIGSKDVAASLEWHEPCPRDQAGDESTLLKRDDAVLASVHHESGRLDVWTQCGDVDRSEHLAQPVRRFRRGGDALQLIERVVDLR